MPELLKEIVLAYWRRMESGTLEQSIPKALASL
jgi:hypothetical protein